MTRCLLVLGLVTALLSGAQAEPEPASAFVGPGACAACHAQETAVWKGTKHHRSFESIESNPKHGDILAAVGERSMKTAATCTLCHFTMVSTGGGKRIAKSGPSCESCHGAAAGWVKVHADFGRGFSKETETPEHQRERRQRAAAAGMRSPHDLFDIASSCTQCHGMAHPGLDGAVLAKMLQAGHPFEPEWELVRYSQGSVRHRFYPVGVGTENRPMNAAERARMFVIGQAARLLSATQAFEKSSDPGYRAAQKQRADNARDALEPVKALPEVAELLARPTPESARRVAAVAAARDLSTEVSAKLPDPAIYK